MFILTRPFTFQTTVYTIYILHLGTILLSETLSVIFWVHLQRYSMIIVSLPLEFQVNKKIVCEGTDKIVFKGIKLSPKSFSFLIPASRVLGTNYRRYEPIGSAFHTYLLSRDCLFSFLRNVILILVIIFF